jgi:hypothetical protein
MPATFSSRVRRSALQSFAQNFGTPGIAQKMV